ncbi:hypothetical protein FB45DRAFT_934760 [Roridomyces roridus]|uniref:Uncharacterized protein n=1 Tax=Roridomyces roridus TaxID=1738132 RepID=A0AAD7BB82_9AGAR|nr:hypothetical protein FB45DRAFT_934760 [Roridomyces roridus]
MSLESLYRLVYIFALIQFASGLSTIFVYSVDDARDSQFIAVLYALATFYMVYILIPHTTQRDTHAVSRLNKQFVVVNFLLFCWVLSVFMVPLTVGPEIGHTLGRCAAQSFMTPMCLTLALDIGLPVALIVTLTFISCLIYQHAQEVQTQTTPTVEAPTQTPAPISPRPAPRTTSGNGRPPTRSRAPPLIVL